MKFRFWLVLRLMRDPKHWLSVSTILSLIGMMIGVGSLVVGMAVVSGYETTLKRSVIDVFGELMVIRRATADPAVPNDIEELKPHLPGLKASSPFVYVEGILAHKGKLAGVVLEGVEPESAQLVVKISEKVIDGKFDLSPSGGLDGVVIGKGIAEKFGLKIGDEFRLVTPVASDARGSGIKPKMRKFRVNGVVDLGRFDYDSRYVISNLAVAQDFAGIGQRVTGFRLHFGSPELARELNYKISNEAGYNYWARDWYEGNRNLFEAIKIEKAVIFFVLLIIVIAACFNLASSMFLNVMRRFHEVSILKAMGADRRFILSIFSGQALLIGVVGAGLGLILGLLACLGFLWTQAHFELLPKEVYKLNRISLDLRLLDLAAIYAASLLICFLATRIPARRGADLSPVEGLRYE